MSYDLHIVRTPSWLEAAESPITKEEIDGLVGADSELEWSTLDYIDMRNEAGSVVRFPMIRWRGLRCPGGIVTRSSVPIQIRPK